MSEKDNLLFEEYTIDTPENVIFDYHIAGIGSRFIGALVDTFLLGLVLSAVSLMLAIIMEIFGTQPTDIFLNAMEDGSWGMGLVLAFYFLLEFTLMWGYFTFFEIAWNGQTPGKRVAKTRVIQSSGSPASPMSVVIRNLVRIVDWLPWAYLIGLLTMMLNDKSRRLGDYAADTIVIRIQDEQEKGLLDSTSGANMAVKRRLAQFSLEDINRLYETYPHIDRLTPAEYELIEDAVYGPQAALLDSTVRPRLTKIISPKVGGPLPQPPGSSIEATRILKEIILLYNIHHSDSALNQKRPGDDAARSVPPQDN